MLNRLHQFSAFLIIIFLCMHLSNHVLAVFGPDTHILWMERFRLIYRSILFEVALLAAVMVQIASGIFFIFRSWGQRTALDQRLQAWAGLYLVFFFIVHLIDVMQARMSFAMDTNFWFVAAMHQAAVVPLLNLLFYVGAVLAVFIHIACGVYWGLSNYAASSLRTGIPVAIGVAGVVIALLIALAIGGYLYPVDLPRDYEGIFQPATFVD